MHIYENEAHQEEQQDDIGHGSRAGCGCTCGHVSSGFPVDFIVDNGAGLADAAVARDDEAIAESDTASQTKIEADADSAIRSNASHGTGNGHAVVDELRMIQIDPDVAGQHVPGDGTQFTPKVFSMSERVNSVRRRIITVHVPWENAVKQFICGAIVVGLKMGLYSYIIPQNQKGTPGFRFLRACF